MAILIPEAGLAMTLLWAVLPSFLLYVNISNILMYVCAQKLKPTVYLHCYLSRNKTPTGQISRPSALEDLNLANDLAMCSGKASS